MCPSSLNMYLLVLLPFLSLLLIAHPTLGIGTNITVATANIANVTENSFFAAKPGCNLTCGNITVPYPFGIGADAADDSCSLNSYYNLTCDTSVDPPKLKLGELEVLSINQTQFRVLNYVATRCYNQTGTTTNNITSIYWGDHRPYSFSDTENLFTVIGCDAYGVLIWSHLNESYSKNESYSTGCLSMCTNSTYVVDGNCNGYGCCQIDIPKGLKSIEVALGPLTDANHNRSATSFDPCTYAFLGEKDIYHFGGVSDFSNSTFTDEKMLVPVVVDFVVGNQSCANATKSNESYCQQNTTCTDIDTGYSGYRCSCRPGYKNNPYISPGCSDIDECIDPTLNNCEMNAICINTPGSFNCFCKDHYFGDGRTDGRGCNPNASQILAMKLSLGLSFGFLLLLIGAFLLYSWRNRRKLIKLRKQFFQQNGGLLMKEKISSIDGTSLQPTKIFTTDELKKATNNYAENRIVGRGGYGVVYKGPDQRVVAIKKSKVLDGNQVEQFINELSIVTQVNHRNVVKLLGCCFESEVPELVYEYISNGTLFQHIQQALSWLTLDHRLRIAAEAASALSYLHSAASIPIIHRDVKSANILLDENYVAKMADFGASRLVPLDQTQVSTLVQGTFGYLDPEYFHSSQLTYKSDVYSFGVVLAELMTGQKPICPERSEVERNLATYFITSMKENRLFQILEPRLVKEGTLEQLQAIAELVKRCLCLKSEKRPAMKEVAMELEHLRTYRKDQLVNQQGHELNKSLLSGEEPTDIYTFSISHSTSIGEMSGQHDFSNSMTFPLPKSSY